MFEKCVTVSECHTEDAPRRGPHLSGGHNSAVGKKRKWAPPAQPAYVLFQLLRLLGRDVHVDEFNTMKSAELALTNDRLWAKVCASLGWKYSATV